MISMLMFIHLFHLSNTSRQTSLPIRIHFTSLSKAITISLLRSNSIPPHIISLHKTRRSRVPLPKNIIRPVTRHLNKVNPRTTVTRPTTSQRSRLHTPCMHPPYTLPMHMYITHITNHVIQVRSNQHPILITPISRITSH